MTIGILFINVALLCASLILLPTETLARAGGMAGARAFSAPVLRAPAVRPAVAPHAAPNAIARPAIHGSITTVPGGVGGPLVRTAPAVLNSNRTLLDPGRARLDPGRTLLDPSRTTLHHDNMPLHASRPLAHVHHRIAGPQLWWGGFGGYYYDPSYYDPGYYDPARFAPTAEPQLAYPMDLGPVPYNNTPPPVRRGCTSEQYKVPAEGGGESTINIVRC